MKGLKLTGIVNSTSTKDFEFNGEKGVALEIKIKNIKIDEMLCVLFDDMAETAMEHIQEGDKIQIVGNIIRTDNGDHIIHSKVLALLGTKEDDKD